MIPIVIPTLTKTWNISIARMPPAISAPNRFFAIVRMRSVRQISSAYSDSTSAAPAKPYVSPTTRRRSRCGSRGGSCSPVCVAWSTPRPVFSPEPIAISDWLMLVGRVCRGRATGSGSPSGARTWYGLSTCTPTAGAATSTSAIATANSADSAAELRPGGAGDEEHGQRDRHVDERGAEVRLDDHERRRTEREQHHPRRRLALAAVGASGRR